MTFYKFLTKKAGLLYFGATLLFVFSIFTTQTLGLTAEQKEIYNSNIHYFDLATCSMPSTTTAAPGSGQLDSATFPSADPTALANAINQWISKENSNSKLSGLGTTIVSSAKAANINPFLIVAIAHEESSLADPSDWNVAHANNSFGREATQSQPHVQGANTWYKWSSVKSSVDSTASENQNAQGGGDIAAYLRNQYSGKIDSSDLTSLFLAYAPPSENNTTQYTANVKSWIKNLASLAGGTVSADTTTPTDASCCTSSSITSVTGNDHAQKAFNYFVLQGLPPAAAAGLVGNFQQESGDKLNTTASNGATYGIAQWLGGRRTKLENFASSDPQNRAVSDLALQLDFVWHELNTNYKSSVLTPLKAISGTSREDTDHAAQIVFDHYEAPGDSSLPRRQANAWSVLQSYGGSAPSSSPESSDAAICTSNSGSSDISAYKNPFRDVHNLSGMRIDEGVDYGGSGPVYAIGNAKLIKAVKDPGWPGGTWIVYQLTDGPAQGKYVYFAENCDIKVSTPATLTSSTVICNMVNASPHTETGWAADPSGGNIAAAYSVYQEGFVTAYGVNFAQLMKCVGDTTSHERQTAQVHGTLPAGWPKWSCG